MKAIVELTPDEHSRLHDIYVNLRAAIKDVPCTDIVEDLQRRYVYAHYRFSGKYTPRLIELLGRQPSADEIIMLVDGGFSHFGATCTINHETREFQGRVNTD